MLFLETMYRITKHLSMILCYFNVLIAIIMFFLGTWVTVFYFSTASLLCYIASRLVEKIEKQHYQSKRKNKNE